MSALLPSAVAVTWHVRCDCHLRMMGLTTGDEIGTVMRAAITQRDEVMDFHIGGGATDNAGGLVDEVGTANTSPLTSISALGGGPSGEIVQPFPEPFMFQAAAVAKGALRTLPAADRVAIGTDGHWSPGHGSLLNFLAVVRDRGLPAA